MIETILKPFARLADRLFGTQLTGCIACARRRDRLDRWTAALTPRLRRYAAMLPRRAGGPGMICKPGAKVVGRRS